MKHQRQLSYRPLSCQSGIVLFIALTAVAVMAFAALALMRSSGTSSTIAGNLSFRQVATQATDTGIELAYAALTNIEGSNPDADVANQYSAVRLASDANGLPQGVNWESLPCRDPFDLSQSVPDCKVPSTSGYVVRYYIDRQCSGTLPIADLLKSCLAEDKGKLTRPDSHAVGQHVFKKDKYDVSVLYRVTVQVRGPRGTESFVQAVLTL
jgi:type IV pilus assembly protein PilX